MTEDEKQRYFEEGYDQCFREVIDEIKSWKHSDTKSFIMWLSKTFKASAATVPDDNEVWADGAAAGLLEITGIRNPDSSNSYDGLSYDEQRRQFVRDAGEDENNPTAIVVLVQDRLGGALVGDQSGWLEPQAVAAWVDQERSNRK